MMLCSEPGRSTRTILDDSGSSTGGMLFCGISLLAQFEKNDSSIGTMSSRLVSPTTIIVALLGLNQVS